MNMCINSIVRRLWHHLKTRPQLEYAHNFRHSFTGCNLAYSLVVLGPERIGTVAAIFQTWSCNSCTNTYHNLPVSVNHPIWKNHPGGGLGHKQPEYNCILSLHPYSNTFIHKSSLILHIGILLHLLSHTDIQHPYHLLSRDASRRMDSFFFLDVLIHHLRIPT